ncbi:MAG TPA: hypothetical protein VF971_01730 [Candidatus Limnocylindrales bacterium]|jgi:hypothetical protein
MTIEQLAGWSALVAAVASVVGAVFLGLFFSRGQPWGTWNDIASIVLMLAMVPVALVVAAIESELFATYAWLAAGIGVLGMLVATVAQALLVARVRTYEQLLPGTLGGGAIVGFWYVLAGLLGFNAIGSPLAALMVASGVGFVAIGYGFAAGGQRHPLSAIGGVVLLIGSTAFLGWLGWRLVSGDLVVPSWNA